MDKQQAQEIVRDTFESSFNKSSFIGFIKNLLNRIDDAPFTYQGNYIPDAYKQYIKKLERIGKFSAGENSVDILVITLQKKTSLERARTMQRNFVAWYLNGSRGGVMKDAALAAFVSPDEADWRFSLVKMDYKFEKTKTGRMKVKEEFTPARRWSFLVGANEKSHTAQSRLVKILSNDEQAPTLGEIENVFDIETVTKEFFLKYRELFLRTKEELDRVIKKDSKIKADFRAKGVDTVNFAKKLLGQIVFLYFLQKKGWFGVGRDNDWGTGPKHFLRELFEKKHADYDNFFNAILEPLFYEALRTGEDRKHEDYYYSRFDCRIPFLNGGLFDPIGNYDWVHTDINLPDALFSNTKKTKEGDIGDGILDIFDRFNFTVKEDEPLEKEVAIDPELLGKAYEKFNAIRPDNFKEYKKALKSGKKGDESKFNKQFGVYYTPREIVHYMCQQSLINYLYSEFNKGPISYEKFGDPQLNMLGNKDKRGQFDLTIEHKSTPCISKEDIETLIHIGELVSENEEIALIKEQNIKDGKQKTSDYRLTLPESIRNNASLIDHKLEEITVCDPAVGSGAFPVGMMSEIVRMRSVLSKFVQGKNRTPYEFKRRCIEHSLYGVDIDPGAVEIAKLRLWLSLVVDEDDINNIKPLPNLDYRIMQGNSLISEFMGINFDTDKEQNNENLMFKDEVDELTEKFQHKKDEFLNESNVTRKTKLKEEIDDLMIEIFETELESLKTDYFSKLEKIENKHSNWPKEEQRKKYIKEDKEQLYKESGFNLESVEEQLKEFTSGRKIKPFFLWNLYFSEVFQNNGGFDVVIANPPYGANIDDMVDKYRAIYPEVIKNYADIFKIFYKCGLDMCKVGGVETYITPNTFLAQPRYKDLRKVLLQYDICSIINLGEEVFDAVVPVCVTITLNQPSQGEYSFSDISHNSNFNGRLSDISFKRISTKNVFRFKDFSLLQKITLKDDELYFDEALEIKDAGIQYHRSGIGLKNKGGNDLYDRIFSSNKNDFKNSKPTWYGKLIDTYYMAPSTNEYFNRNYKDVLKSNETVSFSNEAFNEIHKILWRQTASHLKAVLDTKGRWFRNTIQCCWLRDGFKDKFDLRYILAVINSSYLKYLYNELVNESGRVFPQVKITHVKKLPLKYLDMSLQKPFIFLVDKIVSIAQSNNYLGNPSKQAQLKQLQKQIDQMVYKLYGLTKEEITIVENSRS